MEQERKAELIAAAFAAADSWPMRPISDYPVGAALFVR